MKLHLELNHTLKNQLLKIQVIWRLNEEVMMKNQSLAEWCKAIQPTGALFGKASLAVIIEAAKQSQFWPNNCLFGQNKSEPPKFKTLNSNLCNCSHSINTPHPAWNYHWRHLADPLYILQLPLQSNLSSPKELLFFSKDQFLLLLRKFQPLQCSSRE